MENKNKNIDMVTPGGTPASSRWNPTKEQITMLENLYREGIRTPSAEHIQQITSRLRAYGHIEGKNVFYWFQNHKARQRQKQKQENMNLFLHNRPPSSLLISTPTPPPPPHPCTNVVCSPYYMTQGGVGFYPPPHYPKVLLPGGTKKRPLMDKMEKWKEVNIIGECADEQQRYNGMISMEGGDGNEGTIFNSNNSSCGHKTLALFPQHPTGILESRRSSNSFQESNSWSSSQTSIPTVAEEGCGQQPFIDFFGEEASSEGE